MDPTPPHPASEQTFSDPVNPNVRTPFPSISQPPTIDLSVVVPAYNEQIRLPQMLDETLNYLQTRAHRSVSPQFAFEIIIVDDGSKDNTVGVVMNYVQQYGTECVRLLRMRQNAGKGGAVRQGMLSARGRYVLMADADAATVFADVEKLERVISHEDVDVAIGSRIHLKGRGQKEGRGLLRGFISTVFNLVVVHVGGVTGLQDTQCGFKLYSREAARIAFTGQMLRRWAFDVENLYRVQKAGLRVVEVPVQWTEVPGSKLSVVKATLNMLCDMVHMRIRYETGSWTLATPPRVTN